MVDGTRYDNQVIDWNTYLRFLPLDSENGAVCSVQCAVWCIVKLSTSGGR